MEIRPISYYEKEIQERFMPNHCGIDLRKIGPLSNRRVFPVNFSSAELLDIPQFESKMQGFVEFLKMMFTDVDTRTPWFRFNVIDQAVNEYIGIGLLNRFSNWPRFALEYLSEDRAEQSGDSCFVIFDLEFEWALSLTLVQDEDQLVVELFKK